MYYIFCTPTTWKKSWSWSYESNFLSVFGSGFWTISWWMRVSSTLSEIQYERRKTKPVANFIHTRSVEYEFIIKNQFYYLTSKLGYLWLFLSAPVQAAPGDKNKMLALEHSKIAQFSKNLPNAPYLWCPIMKFFCCEFTLYPSNMYEICTHCHWLGFSSIILNLGHCVLYDCRKVPTLVHHMLLVY